MATPEKETADIVNQETSTSVMRLANLGFSKDEAVEAGKTVARDVIAEVKMFAEDGPMSLRVLGFVSGLGTFLFSFFAIFKGVLGISPLVAATNIFIMFFGLIVMSLEAKKKIFSTKLRQAIDVYARALTLIMGRGLFYIYVGALLSSLSSSINDTYGFCAGFMLLVVGALYIYTGRVARRKLKVMRDSMRDEGTLKKKFDFYAQGDQKLDLTELSKMCAELGSQLSPQELEAALMMLDSNRNGYVEFDEFKQWWASDDQFVY